MIVTFDFLVPDYVFESFDKADAAFLSSIGVKAILLDVDNTLEPYENAVPGPHVKAWIESLASVGIQAAIISNNNSDRIDKFNEELGLISYSKAKKPFKKNLVLAMSQLNVEPKNVIFMGDQIFTDVWAARNAGIKAILVPPIKDKTDLFTKFKRWLEKPVLKKYSKIKNMEENKI